MRSKSLINESVCSRLLITPGDVEICGGWLVQIDELSSLYAGQLSLAFFSHSYSRVEQIQ